MTNQASFSAATPGAKVTGTLTDDLPVYPQVPPQATKAFGPRITPHFITDPWSADNSYNFFDVVLVNGISYIARVPVVPAGTEITDTDYWVPWYGPNAQFQELLNTVNQFDGRINKNENSINSIKTFNNIMDYGADNTGSEDSSTALTNALADKLPVYIPAGEYIINNPVVIDNLIFGDSNFNFNDTKISSNITLNNTGALIFNYNGSAENLKIISNNDHCITINSSHKKTFKNLRLEKSNISAIYFNIPSISWVESVIFDSISIGNAGRDAVSVNLNDGLSYCNIITFINCSVRGIGVTNNDARMFRLIAGNNHNNIYSWSIINCEFDCFSSIDTWVPTNIGDTPIYTEGLVNYITLINNTFECTNNSNVNSNYIVNQDTQITQAISISNTVYQYAKFGFLCSLDKENFSAIEQTYNSLRLNGNVYTNNIIRTSGKILTGITEGNTITIPLEDMNVSNNTTIAKIILSYYGSSNFYVFYKADLSIVSLNFSFSVNIIDSHTTNNVATITPTFEFDGNNLTINFTNPNTGGFTNRVFYEVETFKPNNY